MRWEGWHQLSDAINVYIKEGYIEPNKDWSSYVPNFEFQTENKRHEL